MRSRSMVWGALAVLLGSAACDHPTGPAAEIAGEYELTARVQNAVETPVAPGGDGAVLVLRTDRTWLLTRHRGPRPTVFEGFGLTDRYRFQTEGPAHALTMFSEAISSSWYSSRSVSPRIAA